MVDLSIIKNPLKKPHILEVDPPSPLELFVLELSCVVEYVQIKLGERLAILINVY